MAVDYVGPRGNRIYAALVLQLDRVANVGKFAVLQGLDRMLNAPEPNLKDEKAVLLGESLQFANKVVRKVLEHVHVRLEHADVGADGVGQREKVSSLGQVGRDGEIGFFGFHQLE